MNKPTTFEALNFLKKTVYLSKVLKTFLLIEKAVVIISAAMTVLEALLVFRNIKN